MSVPEVPRAEQRTSDALADVVIERLREHDLVVCHAGRLTAVEAKAAAADRLAEAAQQAYEVIYELIPPPSGRTATEQQIVAKLKPLRAALAGFSGSGGEQVKVARCAVCGENDPLMADSVSNDRAIEVLARSLSDRRNSEVIWEEDWDKARDQVEALAGAGLQITDLTADTARWLVAELEGTVEAHRHAVETEPELDNPQSRALIAGLAELRRISGGSE